MSSLSHRRPVWGLFLVVAVASALVGVSLQPARAATGFYIVVDQTTQHAKVFTDAGEYIRLIPISSGRGGATPNGNFAIYSKSRWTTSSSNGNVTMPFMSRIVGGIGFHGIPRNRGVPMPTPLGVEPVSAGCIRMSDADAEWVYTNMPVGTPVFVTGRWNGPTPPPDPPGPPPPQGGVPVAVGDFDGDGRSELVTGAGLQRPSTVSIWRRTNGALDRVAQTDAYGGFQGGVHVGAGDVDGDGRDEVITAPGTGGGPHVRIFDVVGTSLVERGAFLAYSSSFSGGVTVGAGDVDNDGLEEVVTGPVVGSPHVRVFDVVGATVVEQAGFFAYASLFSGGVSVAAGDTDDDGFAEVITGTGSGSPHVRVLNVAGGSVSEQTGFFAYSPTFTGGVHVGTADQDGDGFDEVITGPGMGGGPHVRVLDVSGAVTELAGYFAYAAEFKGGVFVAGGNTDGMGGAEMVTGAGPNGSPHVRVTSVSGAVQTPVVDFMLDAMPVYTGGSDIAAGDVDGDGVDEIVAGPGGGRAPTVRWFDGRAGSVAHIGAQDAYPGVPVAVNVATGDVDGDGNDEVITGPGRGGGPHVRVFDVVGTSLVEVAAFMAYASGFKGGVDVAAGDVDNDGRDEIVTAVASDGSPHVRVLDVVGSSVTEQAGFYAYASSFSGGVAVAIGDVDGDGFAELITGAGPGGAPHVRVLDVAGGTVSERTSFLAYAGSFGGGVNVAAGNADGDPHAEILTGPGGGGGPHIRLLDVSSGLAEQFAAGAYETWMTQGVDTALGDVDGDGVDEIATATGPGGSTRLDMWNELGPSRQSGLFVY